MYGGRRIVAQTYLPSSSRNRQRFADIQLVQFEAGDPTKPLKNPITEGYAIFSHYASSGWTPLGRGSAGISDCAGFAPN